MAITANEGPYVGFGRTVGGSTDGITATFPSINTQRGPSLFDLGSGMLDPRAAYAYTPGNPTTTKVWGFIGEIVFADFVPLTKSSIAFITTTTVTTGVTGNFTIASSSGVGTYTVSITAPESGQAVTGLITFDSSVTQNLSFGSDGTISYWNPGALVGRALSITTSSSGDGGTWTVSGRDVYGYKMTEAFSIAGGTSNSSGYTINGKKAFKYISAISNCSTPVSTGVQIGSLDTFGFPASVPYCGQNVVVSLMATSYSSVAAVLLSSANTVLASTVTETSTTPDVRGTYASTTASNGTLRMQIMITPSASALAAVTSTNVAPIFGLTQYSSV